MRKSDIYICPLGFLPINWLYPVYNPLWEWSALALALGRWRDLHPGTRALIVWILSRISAALKPSEPFPSFYDLNLIIQHLGHAENPKHSTMFQTLSECISALEPLLGKFYYLRGPGIWPEHHFPIVIIELPYDRASTDLLYSFYSLKRFGFAVLKGQGVLCRRVEFWDEALRDFSVL